MVQYANELINDYAELKDNNKIYPPKEFSFIYGKQDGKWIYEGTQRLSDRNIFEQKAQVNDLIARGIDEILLQMINSGSYIENDKIQLGTINYNFR